MSGHCGVIYTQRSSQTAATAYRQMFLSLSPLCQTDAWQKSFPWSTCVRFQIHHLRTIWVFTPHTYTRTHTHTHTHTLSSAKSRDDLSAGFEWTSLLLWGQPLDWPLPSHLRVMFSPHGPSGKSTRRPLLIKAPQCLTHTVWVFLASQQLELLNNSANFLGFERNSALCVWMCTYENWQLTLWTRAWVSIKQSFLACWISSLQEQLHSASRDYLDKPEQYCSGPVKGQVQSITCRLGCQRAALTRQSDTFHPQINAVWFENTWCFIFLPRMFLHFLRSIFIQMFGETNLTLLSSCSRRRETKNNHPTCSHITTGYRVAHMSVFTSEGVPNITWGHLALNLLSWSQNSIFNLKCLNIVIIFFNYC